MAKPSWRGSFKGLWAFFRSCLSLKTILRGVLCAFGILPFRGRGPCPGTWAKDRYGRWELRVPAQSLNEPSPDKW